MKKIFILLVPIFLLVSCVEQVAVLGTGVTNGKVVQTSLQSGVSFGVKKATGKEINAPTQLSNIVDKDEKFDIVENNISKIKNYILEKAL